MQHNIATRWPPAAASTPPSPSPPTAHLCLRCFSQSLEYMIARFKTRLLSLSDSAPILHNNIYEWYIIMQQNIGASDSAPRLETCRERERERERERRHLSEKRSRNNKQRDPLLSKFIRGSIRMQLGVALGVNLGYIKVALGSAECCVWSYDGK